jgi:hypothetical protein
MALWISFFSWQEIRNIQGEGNDENKTIFQVYYIRKPFIKIESYIGSA